MEMFTGRHGLAPLKPVDPIDSDDIVDNLTYELTLELERLRKVFTVDAEKLKEISRRFEEELQEGKHDASLLHLSGFWLTKTGLDKYESNIVCSSVCMGRTQLINASL